MKVRLNAIQDGQQKIESTYQREELEIHDDCFIYPIHTCLNIYKGTGQITINGHLQTKVDLLCDRCLRHYQHCLTARFELIARYAPAIPQNRDENILQLTSNQTEIELTKFARDALLLEIPMKKICSKDCRGICPHCGVDLNSGECQCRSKGIDERWKPLQNLLTNMMEES